MRLGVQGNGHPRLATTRQPTSYAPLKTDIHQAESSVRPGEWDCRRFDAAEAAGDNPKVAQPLRCISLGLYPTWALSKVLDDGTDS